MDLASLDRLRSRRLSRGLTVGRRSYRARVARFRAKRWQVAQCAVAAAVAWLVARHALGHEVPVFAPIAPEPPPPPMETRELVYEGDYKTFRERWIDEGERRYLRQMMERHHKNVTAIAREAGVARTYIYRLMRKHGL